MSMPAIMSGNPLASQLPQQDREGAEVIDLESHLRFLILKNGSKSLDPNSSAIGIDGKILSPDGESVLSADLPRQVVSESQNRSLHAGANEVTRKGANQETRLDNQPASLALDLSQLRPQAVWAGNHGPHHLQQPRPPQQHGLSQLMPETSRRVSSTSQNRNTYINSRQSSQPLRNNRQYSQNSGQAQDARSHGQPSNNLPTTFSLPVPRSNYVTNRRPTPQNRQLYDPHSNASQHSHQAHGSNQLAASTDPIHNQINYLEQLASIEIPKAEMGVDELEAKENFRVSLEMICRDAIAQHELQKDKDFDPSTVTLKCFGSLSSGFATHSSDMDLALISPRSSPDTSSLESEIPRLLEKVLLDLGFGARLLTRTRVPIIKLCEKPTPELAQALLEERAKWEQERDAPPKPKLEGSKTKNEGQESKHGSKNDSASENLQTNGISKRNNDTSQASNITLGHTYESKAIQLNSLGGNSVTTEDKKSEGSLKVDELAIQDDMPRSDEELVFLYNLAMDEGWYDAEERKTVKTFLDAVNNSASGADDASLTTARLELKSLTKILHRYRAPVENHLDFPKTGVGIQCDINFSNPLALHNTLLLKCYSLCDPRVRPLIIFVKAWAKRRKINSPYHGTLSSYGYVLMVLHYLVNIARPPIVPNLQRIRKASQDNSPGNDAKVDGCTVRFWRSECEIKELARRGMLTRNTADNIGSLLRGFFHYFAHQGYYSPNGGFGWSLDVLSLRSEGGLLSKKSKDWTGARTITIEPTAPGGATREIRQRYLLAIEDPFELEHNIARTVVHNGIVAIRNEFRRAHSIIQSVGPRNRMEDLFAEAENRDHLGRRAFGPLPRNEEAETPNKDQSTAGTASKERMSVNADKAQPRKTAPRGTVQPPEQSKETAATKNRRISSATKGSRTNTVGVKDSVKAPAKGRGKQGTGTPSGSITSKSSSSHRNEPKGAEAFFSKPSSKNHSPPAKPKASSLGSNVQASNLPAPDPQTLALNPASLEYGPLAAIQRQADIMKQEAVAWVHQPASSVQQDAFPIFDTTTSNSKATTEPREKANPAQVLADPLPQLQQHPPKGEQTLDTIR